MFRRKTPEEKAARREQSERFKAEMRERLDRARNEQEEAWRSARQAALDSMLQADETVEAILRTGEAILKKDVIFTSRRLIIMRVGTAGGAESISYRNVTTVRTQSFITKDIVLDISGRRDSLELSFREAADRDRAASILNRYAF